jgi:hypothetical protein
MQPRLAVNRQPVRRNWWFSWVASASNPWRAVLRHDAQPANTMSDRRVRKTKGFAGNARRSRRRRAAELAEAIGQFLDYRSQLLLAVIHIAKSGRPLRPGLVRACARASASVPAALTFKHSKDPASPCNAVNQFSRNVRSALVRLSGSSMNDR